MLPQLPISFPHFVANQLLTAKNLNDLFHYLDEQQRGTRTNLIGIGIVCGLELSLDTTKAEVTISTGCGITSAGYLVRWDAATFQHFTKYDVNQEIAYTQFLEGGKERFELYELKRTSAEEGTKKISADWLKDKVVMLFVELIDTEAKNCDPESCDDKGRNVTYTIRPLVVDRKSALLLQGNATNGSPINRGWNGLPIATMPRHHVPASLLYTTEDVLEGFLEKIDKNFLRNLAEKLSYAFEQLGWIGQNLYPKNPFKELEEKMAGILGDDVRADELIYAQYYYDFVSDLIAAYNELRMVGNQLLSICCPSETLFPRHLLLGSIANLSSPRHSFIPSPAVAGQAALVEEVRRLLHRIVVMINEFNPNAKGVFNRKKGSLVDTLRGLKNQSEIRITPSKYGDFPLSDKAIPYYYNILSGEHRLLDQWRNPFHQALPILSYHADLYASKRDAETIKPLYYDLEPYNFLRIEGHVGSSYTSALAAIYKIKNSTRLPIDVLALSADSSNLLRQLGNFAKGRNADNLELPTERDFKCHFADLQANYDAATSELLCTLCSEASFYYRYPPLTGLEDVTPKQNSTEVPFFKTCSPGLTYREGTLGADFEAFWKQVGTQNYKRPDQLLTVNRLEDRVLTHKSPTAELQIIQALLYYIVKTAEIMTTNLQALDIAAFITRYSDLQAVANTIKERYRHTEADENGNVSGEGHIIKEDFFDHLDLWAFGCHEALFIGLYNNYRTRFVQLAMLQKIGYYGHAHPGLQHKAGVTMGGTFIMIYHEKAAPARAKESNLQQVEVAEKDIEDLIKNLDIAATIKAADRKKITENTRVLLKKMMMEKEAEDKKKIVDARGNTDHLRNVDDEKEIETVTVTATGRKTHNNHLPFSPIDLRIAKALKLDEDKMLQSIGKKGEELLKLLKGLDEKPTNDHPLSKAISTIPDGIVIADFYLPYICCSDCPPVQYIIGAEPEPVEELSISMDTKTFCGGDERPKKITVSPIGGEVKGNGVKPSDDTAGEFVFVPASAELKDAASVSVEITYSFDGRTKSITVEVFAKPKPAFKATPTGRKGELQFENLSEFADEFIWKFGDGKTSKDKNPIHGFEEEGEFDVTLTASNKVCPPVPKTETVSVSEVKISLPQSDFCQQDKNRFAVSTQPAGGKISGEGIVENEKKDGFDFIPGATTRSSTQTVVPVTLTYELFGTKTTVTAQVFQKLDATITAVQNKEKPNNFTFSAANKLKGNYAWDFGDGQTSTTENPSNTYKEDGNFTVSLTLTNGPCVSTDSTTVSPKAERVNNDTPRTKDCGSVTEIANNYAIFIESLSGNRELWMKIYQSQTEVDTFMKLLGTLGNRTVAQQLAIFSNKRLADNIHLWMNNLSVVLVNKMKAQGLQLFTILIELATYIACLQPGEIANHSVSMRNAMMMVQRLLKLWQKQLADLTIAEKKIVNDLQLLLRQELEKIRANDETENKSLYAKQLQEILSGIERITNG